MTMKEEVWWVAADGRSFRERPIGIETIEVEVIARRDYDEFVEVVEQVITDGNERPFGEGWTSPRTSSKQEKRMWRRTRRIEQRGNKDAEQDQRG